MQQMLETSEDVAELKENKTWNQHRVTVHGLEKNLLPCICAIVFFLSKNQLVVATS